MIGVLKVHESGKPVLNPLLGKGRLGSGSGEEVINQGLYLQVEPRPVSF